MTSQTPLPVRKWYFAINEAGGANYASRLAKVAVLSAQARTTLQPICLFNGKETALIHWLQDRGIATVAHTPSTIDSLAAGYGPELPKYVGHWLRVDIPEIETEDDFILYTDIDVMFMANPIFTGDAPRYFSAAPEHDRDNFSYFNSGVMIMNLAGLRAVRPDFLRSIRDRMTALTYPPHDQGSFNTFFRNDWDRLPEGFNWKPYWGVNEAATIVHFHGTKPEHATAILGGRDPKPDSSWTRIVDRNRDAYRFYCSAWSHVLAEDPSARKRRAKTKPRAGREATASPPSEERRLKRALRAEKRRQPLA